MTWAEPNDADDPLFITKFRDRCRKYRRAALIGIDKHPKHKLSYKIYRLKDLIPKLVISGSPCLPANYNISFVKNGDEEKTISLYTFPVIENTLCIIAKRIVHYSKYFSSDCCGFVLSFDRDAFSNTAIYGQSMISRKVLKNSVGLYLYLNDWQANLLSEIFECVLGEHQDIGGQIPGMIAIKMLKLLMHNDRLLSEATLIAEGKNFNPPAEKFLEFIVI